MRAVTPLDQPRAIGKVYVSSKKTPFGSAIDGLRQSGACKVLFPTSADRLEAILLNTSGGVTGGDCFDIEAKSGAGSHMLISTQAAERGYRAQPGQQGTITTRLCVEEDSTLFWVPQETILYDGAAIDRRLGADIAKKGRFLMIEPVVFGRHAMGEHVHDITFSDRVDIRFEGKPLYRDGVRLDGNVAHQLDRPAIGNGARAMAGLVYFAPDASAKLEMLRDHLGSDSGASLLGDGLLVARIVAADGYDLRRVLLPILEHFTMNAVPKSWRL